MYNDCNIFLPHICGKSYALWQKEDGVELASRGKSTPHGRIEGGSRFAWKVIRPEAVGEVGFKSLRLESRKPCGREETGVELVSRGKYAPRKGRK